MRVPQKTKQPLLHLHFAHLVLEAAAESSLINISVQQVFSAYAL